MTRLALLRKRFMRNTKRLRFRRPNVGARPGVLVFSDEATETQVNSICYSPDVLRHNPEDLEDLVANKDVLCWIDVQGLKSEVEIKRIAKLASIPDLMLEDIVNVPQRSRSDSVDGRLLIVTRMIRPDKTGAISIEQVSIYVYENIIVTFQEEEGDVFSAIRQRLHNAKGPLRNSKADFLAYTLLATIVDAYFPLLEHMADRLQILEHYALMRPTSGLLRHLVSARNDALRLHRAVKPQKELFAGMLRDKTSLLSEEVRMYLNDSHDHTIQAADVTDTLREMSINLLNLYMSSMANHTNDKMKVLTIMASIFIPLTFIAGVYGMNFDYMPELHVVWGYPAVWIVMAATAMALMIYFYRKGWITDHNRDLDQTLREHFSEIATRHSVK
ncbi:magnesium/cobalt transporter CorA [Rubinisphaera margarita]|uniref:magnesium/cobalt transporter CorA n=1 Tax=Rubinisphaera margarita TaxID=2909586 RepID=UPI001EE90B27|nr:magnesium/cobalt transporter CorA [Rubinisphaera margarita]MCG6154255.1 magnesium/cobalt transporter CorA [Rubinisphaera margarita]